MFVPRENRTARVAVWPLGHLNCNVPFIVVPRCPQACDTLPLFSRFDQKGA